MSKLIAFGWMGGKYAHLNTLLPLLPEAHCFVDVFGGSGSVIINREPSPIEVYNDIDRNLVNFFQILRNAPDKLIRSLELTPYSREEFNNAFDALESDNCFGFERARAFYIRCTMSFSGLGQNASRDSWSQSKTFSRRHMSAPISKYLSKIEALPQLVERFKTILIENKDAIDLIDMYDSKNTLFYIDPPYVESTRAKNLYAYEIDDAYHARMLTRLRSIQGRFALSGYDSEIYDAFTYKFNRQILSEKTASSSGKIKTEILWTNY